MFLSLCMVRFMPDITVYGHTMFLFYSMFAHIARTTNEPGVGFSRCFCPLVSLTLKDRSFKRKGLKRMLCCVAHWKKISGAIYLFSVHVLMDGMELIERIRFNCVRPWLRGTAAGRLESIWRAFVFVGCILFGWECVECLFMRLVHMIDVWFMRFYFIDNNYIFGLW